MFLGIEQAKNVLKQQDSLNLIAPMNAAKNAEELLLNKFFDSFLSFGDNRV